jgi:hypothetical protein
MTLIWEKIVVTAKEFLNDKNINDSFEFNEPLFQTKLKHFDWDLKFAAASIFCELVWKEAIGKHSLTEFQQLDRLFSPSPIATHSNFRGCRQYKTGNLPEPGALAIWRKGNTWQGHMAIVTSVSDDQSQFNVIDARAMEGSQSLFLSIEERPDKKMGQPFKNDKLNLVGFIYAPNREIS